jgi:hypothetical protein
VPPTAWKRLCVCLTELHFRPRVLRWPLRCECLPQESTPGNGQWIVSTWVGGGSSVPDGIGPSGLQDGFRSVARFTFPQGIVADDDGTLFVADTGNFVVRYVDTQGNVSVLAGTVVSMLVPDGTENAGCPRPCVRGVQGFDDGPRNVSKFNNPVGITLGPNGTVRYMSIRVDCCAYAGNSTSRCTLS